MGSLPSRRKQVTAQANPQSNLRNSQGLGNRPSGGDPPIVVAVSDFPSGHAEPIVRMGEQLDLLSEEGEWWKVQSTLTGKDCYVPSSHIVKIFHGWLYEGISRAKAEELLLLPSNQEGSFLLRERQMSKGCYSLSIRHRNHGSWDCVKHYRIISLENNWLYISPSITFSSLQELVDYYSETGDGLCCSLKKPCSVQRSTVGFCSKPIVVKPSPLNWQDINSSDLLVENPLPENSPISLGLRETVTSYLLMAEDGTMKNVLGKNEK